MLFMGKSTISMVIFNSYVKLSEGMLVLYQLTRSFWPGLSIFPDCQRYFMYCVALGALGALRGACHALEPTVGLLTALTSSTNPIGGHSNTYHIANTRIKGQVIGQNR